MLENRDPSGDEARPPASRASSPHDAAVVQVLRRYGAAMTSTDIEKALQEAGTPVGYTTLVTVLINLTEEGVILRHEDDRGFRYEALPQAQDGTEASAEADPQLLDRLHRFLRDEV